MKEFMPLRVLVFRLRARGAAQKFVFLVELPERLFEPFVFVFQREREAVVQFVDLLFQTPFEKIFAASLPVFLHHNVFQSHVFRRFFDAFGLLFEHIAVLVLIAEHQAVVAVRDLLNGAAHRNALASFCKNVFEHFVRFPIGKFFDLFRFQPFAAQNALRLFVLGLQQLVVVIAYAARGAAVAAAVTRKERGERLARLFPFGNIFDQPFGFLRAVSVDLINR